MSDYDNDEFNFVEEVENIPHETKNDAFLRLVNKRLPYAVKRMRMVKNLAAKNAYDYTPQQAGQVVAVLRTELEEIERAFFSDEADDEVPTIT